MCEVDGVLKGQDIVCISSIDWDFIWQGHQQIMSTLAANGNRVLFVENTGVRRPNFKDIPRLRKRIRNWWRGTKGFRQEQDNLFVYSPLVLPFPYSRVARWMNRFIITRAIRRWIQALGLQRPLVWTFLPTPLALDIIDAIEPTLVIYYCIDDFESSSSGARLIRQTEDRLLKAADLVFVTSERLRHRVLEQREQVEVLPFAVDFPRFEKERLANQSKPNELVEIDSPIVGYVGGLHRWVDQELLVEAARVLPDVEFVFVGPEQCDMSKLKAQPNIHLLGSRNYDELPRYIKCFDVGLIPYVLSEYALNVYPTKLNEYLAMGLPVVATNLPEVRKFNEDFSDVVRIGDGPASFASQIQESLANNTPAQVQRRIEVASQNSWQARLEHMSTLITTAITVKLAGWERWEKVLQRLYRAGRRRIGWTAATALVGYVLVFQTPLLWTLASPLQIVDVPRKADVIAVFAGGVGESGRAGGGYQERVQHAANLYLAGYSSHLVFSSGFVFAFQEAEVMRDLAVALGVPPDAIILERQASSTYENVIYTRDIMIANNWEQLLVVSSPYHMRRAMLTWRKQAPSFQVVSTPVSESQYYAHERTASLEQIRGIVWEYAAIVVYWWRGWL
tara:strand:- start:2029 stop:3888 length:1860 start_codon:yes stop_codon:yes gene_type:complete